MEFLNEATVNTLYFVLLAMGMLYALILLFSGQLGAGADLGADAPDFNLDLDGDVALDVEPAGDLEGGFSPISPLTIAAFVTAFGAVGLVATNLFEVSDRASILWATGGGVIFSVLTYAGFTYLLIKPQGSSEVRMADIAGSLAEVITPIPPEGLGEIAFIAQGGRVQFSARGSGTEPIGRGTTVRIKRVVGGIAFVEPAVTE